MNRYKNDIEKIKASDDIKQQTIQMMQKSLHTKKVVNYKRSFQYALSTSLALFVCTVILSIAFIDQRINNQDILLDSQQEMIQIESEEMSEGMSFQSKAVAPLEIEPMMMAESETENLFFDENRIICGEVTHMDDTFIEIDKIRVYIDQYTSYSNDIVVGNYVEAIVYYIDSNPYAEWIELNEQ